MRVGMAARGESITKLLLLQLGLPYLISLRGWVTACGFLGEQELEPLGHISGCVQWLIKKLD